MFIIFKTLRNKFIIIIKKIKNKIAFINNVNTLFINADKLLY